ncbi:hypothetical protein L1887_60014 [Cichorium endivia]|nr:hypothetical protein L1887_60014 [Cichorium endivia]
MTRALSSNSKGISIPHACAHTACDTRATNHPCFRLVQLSDPHLVPSSRNDPTPNLLPRENSAVIEMRISSAVTFALDCAFVYVCSRAIGAVGVRLASV